MSAMRKTYRMMYISSKGAINRTVMTFGPVWRWLFGLRVIADGSKSGGEYLERTFRSDMVAVLFQRCVEISWLCMKVGIIDGDNGSEIESLIIMARDLILDRSG